MSQQSVKQHGAGIVSVGPKPDNFEDVQIELHRLASQIADQVFRYRGWFRDQAAADGMQPGPAAMDVWLVGDTLGVASIKLCMQLTTSPRRRFKVTGIIEAV